MPAYFIASSSIVDLDALAAYERGAGATLADRDVEVLVFSREAEVIEGTPPGTRMVILRFPDRAAFKDWYDSPGYREILPDRLAGTDGFAVLVDGRA